VEVAGFGAGGADRHPERVIADVDGLNDGDGAPETPAHDPKTTTRSPRTPHPRAPVVDAEATPLAALNDEPIPATSDAAAANTSGAAITYDIAVLPPVISSGEKANYTATRQHTQRFHQGIIMKNASKWMAITVVSVTVATLIFAAYVVTITGPTESLVAIGGMVKEVISAFIRA